MPHYELTAYFVCHDVRLADTITLTVERDTAPTPPEAEQILWHRIDKIVNERGGEGCHVDLQYVTFRELPNRSDHTESKAR